MWYHTLNPTLWFLGPWEIRWYGIVYVFGFFITVGWIYYLRQKGAVELSQEQIWDFAFYLLLGVLIGSRLFEVFWEPIYYLSNPLNFLKFWQGGMSFHGGFVGIITACWLYCKNKKLNFWRMADILSVPTILALALGRVANFINGELVGTVWNGKWCVDFSRNQYLLNPPQGCRHPQVLYSAGERLLLFGWLGWLSFREQFKPGFIFWNFVFWEGLGRFLIDFLREDILYGGFTIGQWFSAIMVLAAVIAFLKYFKEDWKQLVQKSKVREVR